MSLPFEYFINKKHMEDLQKLKDVELYRIIKAYYKELEKLNDIKKVQLKDLKKLCDETTEIIKNIKLILSAYKNVYQKDYYNDEERETIDEILYEMDKINFFIKDLKAIKINSKRVYKLVNDLLIFIRMLNLSISELNNN